MFNISNDIFSPSLSLSNHNNIISIFLDILFKLLNALPLSQNDFYVSASNNSLGFVYSQFLYFYGKSL